MTERNMETALMGIFDSNQKTLRARMGGGLLFGWLCD